MTSPFVTGSEDTGLDSMTGIFSKRAGLERIKENHSQSYIDAVRIQRFESKSGFSLPKHGYFKKLAGAVIDGQPSLTHQSSEKKQHLNWSVIRKPLIDFQHD